MTQEEINSLPTLLDIIDHYCFGEQCIELRHESDEFLKLMFPNHLYKGYFEPREMKDGTVALFPLSVVERSMYRGESTYHDECFPSLYRKDMGEADIFVERLKRCELELMMKEYPITSIIEKGIQAQDPSGGWHTLHFRIGYDGLAQHYGIKTEFMDLTTDPWTAAFFAATKYDEKTDTYSIIKESDNRKYGAFYLVNQSFFHNRRIDVIGLQPLARPGRQSGYVFRMEQGENFNAIAQKTLFRHDERVNELIYNYANRGNRLFPHEILNDKIREEIVNGKEFSQWAWDETIKRYYPTESDEKFKEFLNRKLVSIRNTDKQWFSSSEKQLIIDYWETNKSDFLNKIKPRWCYRGPIEENTPEG